MDPSGGCGDLDRLDQRWASRCLRCGGFETVAARPPQPPEGRSRASDGNPMASPPLALAGAVNPPREPQRRHPGLTAPVRVRHSASGLTADLAEVTSKSRRPSCGGLDRLDQRWASRCLRCGGFETVAARPPQPPEGRSHTAGNPMASPPLALAGAVNPPREPQRRHPGLTAPVRVRHSASGLTTDWPRSRASPGAQAAAVSTGSTSAGPAGAFASEVSRRSQRDLLNHRVGTLVYQVSQTPHLATAATPLEMQLGHRPRSPASPSPSCGGLDELDQRRASSAFPAAVSRRSLRDPSTTDPYSSSTLMT